MTSRAGLRLRATPRFYPPLALGGLRRVPCGDPVAVLVAERTRVVLGQGVAVALAVRGAHERRDDIEVPLADLARLAPEVGEAEVDVELEQVDAGRLLGHESSVKAASDGLLRRRPGPDLTPRPAAVGRMPEPAETGARRRVRRPRL